MVAQDQERRSRRAAARLEQRQMALAEDAAQKASPTSEGTIPHGSSEEGVESSKAVTTPKTADAEGGPQSRLSQVPSPARRRRVQSTKGPAPWASSPDGSASTAGPSYRDKLRNSGHNALQRTRDHGFAPKPGSDSTSSPVTVELLKFLDDTKPNPAIPLASAGAGQVQAYGMVPLQQHSPMQGYCLQPVYFQPACYVASAPVVVTPMFTPCDNLSAGAVRCHTPTGFEMNSEQVEEMIRQAREDVYED